MLLCGLSCLTEVTSDEAATEVEISDFSIADVVGNDAIVGHVPQECCDFLFIEAEPLKN